MNEIILHHYEMSPYAEKIRAILGYKNIDWRSAIEPSVMPKPALTALTGGYRRIPVLQIGADIYCDTALIAAHIDKIHPARPILPQDGAGRHVAIGAWAERAIFWPAARLTIAMLADELPMEFHADRAAMWGVQPSIERMRKAAPRYAEQLRALLPMVDSMLDGGHPFLLGAAPGYADFAVYHCLWFLRNGGTATRRLLDAHPAIEVWMARIGDFGNGQARDIGLDETLGAARNAKPSGGYQCIDEENLRRGAMVAIRAEEFGTEQVEGEIVGLTANSITLLRRDRELGEMAVHFPRLGYMIRPQQRQD